MNRESNLIITNEEETEGFCSFFTDHTLLTLVTSRVHHDLRVGPGVLELSPEGTILLTTRVLESRFFLPHPSPHLSLSLSPLSPITPYVETLPTRMRTKY